MKKIKYFLFLMAMFVAVPFMAGEAAAQATRTWVSGVGDDANPCSRTAPCKTYAGAISKTAAGGEISVLDPGGYGAVTITKSISIVARGDLGSTTVAGTNGIIINAGAADVVTLHGLELEGLSKTASPGLSGVKILSAGSVQIEDCTIRDFSVAGVEVVPPTNPVKVSIDRTSIINATKGVLVTAPTVVSTVTVNKSFLAANATSGVEASGAKATIILNDNQIAGSATAMSPVSTGKVLSFGNNALSDNVSNGTVSGVGVLK